MSTAQSGSSNKNKSKQQRGGFVLGLIVGLLLGLAVALGVALYIAKVPIPFIDKVPQRTAEQDAAEAQRNKNWDPNAPLAGKAGVKASGVVSGAPAPAAPAQVAAPASTAPAVAPPAPSASAAAPKAADKAPEKAADKAADKKAEAKAAAASAAAAAADPNLYFVQAGAYVKNEDAEQQRARLALLGFSAKVMEKEQSGRTVFRVRIGPIDSRDEAEGLQRKIEAAGIEANLVGVKR
ncbi:SPOR domain-containing protein [Paucibacter sp. DJ2R-2]|uniref:SPOR domain-containing protein n=1 Tax=Paucibacter sp. DJ2R-2 TaxID=2893558 RepID=UPI0021E41598|nr:SPOR domain-containing protein [Paucibacter sp. DJ2R-2]MCV2419546.1 SPOR domain-containing protein [Paucibacter sp. DJ4R-1]MCV2437551.1 SPOR domain-containing protein [Paucibacter sp. DJ2R-2]